MAKTMEERIYNRCKKQVDKFNAEYEEFVKFTGGDRNNLVDEDGSYYEIPPLQLVQDTEDKLWRLDCDGFLSDPIYDYYEDTKECFDNTGSAYWGDGFKACLNMYKKDLKRGKRWFGYSPEKIDALQDGLIEDKEEPEEE